MVVLKTSKELAKMKRAGSISAQALQVGGAAVRPGVTTGEIDRARQKFHSIQRRHPLVFRVWWFSGQRVRVGE